MDYLDDYLLERESHDEPLKDEINPYSQNPVASSQLHQYHLDVFTCHLT
jgi:hypothetical protein